MVRLLRGLHLEHLRHHFLERERDVRDRLGVRCSLQAFLFIHSDDPPSTCIVGVLSGNNGRLRGMGFIDQGFECNGLFTAVDFQFVRQAGEILGRSCSSVARCAQFRRQMSLPNLRLGKTTFLRNMVDIVRWDKLQRMARHFSDDPVH
jgi:hypothetical protein